MTIPLQIDADHGLAILGSEPHVFHCHHYNCHLQKLVLDSDGLVPAQSLLTAAGADVAYPQFQALHADASLITALFRELGFGTVDLSKLSASGGTVQLASSHYAMGWRSKYGRSDRPVCFFAAGFVEAAARHLFGAPFTAEETRCVARGDPRCEIVVSPGGGALGKSPGLGQLAHFGPRPESATRTSVNEAAIIQACAGLPLSGDAEGLIHAFGVSLSRHYANYYNLVSFRFDQLMQQVGGDGAAEAARLLLAEAGRICAFHTFGGIMESAERDARIKPQGRTREDWIYGMLSVINALGWGRWSVASLEPGARLEVVVDGSYESNGYLASYGRSTVPRCYLASGGAAGLMNLLYNADITARPDLTAEFYEETFRKPGFFVTREVECRTRGHERCRIVADRL